MSRVCASFGRKWRDNLLDRSERQCVSKFFHSSDELFAECGKEMRLYPIAYHKTEFYLTDMSRAIVNVEGRCGLLDVALVRLFVS